jgi:hypothetical protein
MKKYEVSVLLHSYFLLLPSDFGSADHPAPRSCGERDLTKCPDSKDSLEGYPRLPLYFTLTRYSPSAGAVQFVF